MTYDFKKLTTEQIKEFFRLYSERAKGVSFELLMSWYIVLGLDAFFVLMSLADHRKEFLNDFWIARCHSDVVNRSTDVLGKTVRKQIEDKIQQSLTAAETRMEDKVRKDCQYLAEERVKFIILNEFRKIRRRAAETLKHALARATTKALSEQEESLFQGSSVYMSKSLAIKYSVKNLDAVLVFITKHGYVYGFDGLDDDDSFCVYLDGNVIQKVQDTDFVFVDSRGKMSVLTADQFKESGVTRIGPAIY